MRSIRLFFIVGWLAGGFWAAGAQYRFDSWTTDDGLPQNTVFAMTQTPDGYIWFPTFDGLVRFDGVRFKVFNTANSENLTTNRLRMIAADDDGTLWITTELAGLARYRNEKFRMFTTADGLPSDNVYGVAKDPRGGIQVYTDGGTCRTTDQGASFTFERAADHSGKRSYVAPSGTLWEFGREGLAAIDPDGRRRLFRLPIDRPPDKPPDKFNFQSQTALFEDPKDDALWVSAGNLLFELKNGEFTFYGASAGVPPGLIRAIIRDGRDEFWIGTEKNGVCHLKNGRFECFGTKDGLSSDSVTSLFLDREKTLWITTADGGVNRVLPRLITPFSSADGLAAPNVFAILEDSRGAVWIGSAGGLTRYRDGRPTAYTKRNGLLYDIVQALFEDRDGTLWVGSVGGVERLENGKFVSENERLGVPVGFATFTDIQRTRDGALWFASDQGVFRFANGAAVHFKTEDGLPGNDVKKIYEARDGALWFGTTNGLARYAGGRFEVLTKKDGLASNYVRSIYEDEDGYFWFGTYDGGLSLYRDGRFLSIAAAAGLFGNGVFAILPDAAGNFWMSGNQGIFRASRRRLLDFADGNLPAIVSTAYGKSDGMLSTECNGGRQPAAVRTRDGRLWFSTQNGAAVVDPGAVPFNPLPPPVVVEDVLIAGQPVAGDRARVVVEPGENNLEIKYTGLSFIKPEQLRFRYRLDGLEESWTNAGGRRSAYYPYLPPGSYTFRVVAANSDGVWNETGVSLAIEVRPPFYRRWWFVTLAALLAGGVIYGLYRVRIRQLEKERAAKQVFSRQLIASQEQERKRIAAELHDSLGQRLVVIKNLALIFLKRPAAGTAPVEKISAAASEAIEEVTGISYNLRPYQLDRIGLTKAVEGIIATAEEASEIEFSVKMDNIDDYFPKDSEINFFRIVQECVNNIVKHSGARRAAIGIARSGEFVELEISDDGRGFSIEPAAPAKGGFGLLGISERAALFDGRAEIRSAPGQGTSVRMRLKKTVRDKIR